MTRRVARKIQTSIALFVAITTILAASVSVAQVRTQSPPGAVSSAESVPQSGVVSVQLGNFLFPSASSYPVGHEVGITEFVAVADVNGDGRPDLIIAGQNCAGACSGGGKVSVLLANSNGRGFQPPVVYDSGGQWCSSVAVADVNGDGKPDLVVTNAVGKTGGAVGVLLGNGDGSFRPAVMYGSGERADSVLVADVNGDGKPDLVVALDTTRVEVLLGNGDGTFQPGVAYNASGARSIAVADLNHDGKLDLVVAGSGGGHPQLAW